VKIKDITYSSEFVADLEKKIEDLRFKNQHLELTNRLSDAHAAHYREVYKEALKLAIADAMPFVSDWSLMIAENYEEDSELFRECINEHQSSIEGIAEFYFRLVAKNKDKGEWRKRK
jgi:hypothetical protein